MSAQVATVRRTIKASAILNDIRAGLAYPDILEKYHISEGQFRQIVDKLRQAGKIPPDHSFGPSPQPRKRFLVRNRNTGETICGEVADSFAAMLSAAVNAGVSLASADLQGAEIAGADLSGADLAAADLSFADLSGCRLTKARLRDADLTAADLSRSDLTGADLMRANLNGADLSMASACRSDVSGVDFSEANLTGADFSHSNLHRSNLTATDLKGARLDRVHLLSLMQVTFDSMARERARKKENTVSFLTRPLTVLLAQVLFFVIEILSGPFCLFLYVGFQTLNGYLMFRRSRVWGLGLAVHLLPIVVFLCIGGRR